MIMWPLLLQGLLGSKMENFYKIRLKYENIILFYLSFMMFVEDKT